MDVYVSGHIEETFRSKVRCPDRVVKTSRAVDSEAIAERPLHSVARGGGYGHLKFDSCMYDVVTPRICLSANKWELARFYRF